MDKQGHALSGLGIVSPDELERLRDQLSVTTVEEFLDLSNRFPGSVASVLGLTELDVASMAKRVGEAAPAAAEPPATAEPSDDADEYPYATGLDMPEEH